MPGSPTLQDQAISVGDYVVVKFATKKLMKHFVGMVLTTDELEAQITYFKHSGQHFLSPEQPDVSFIELSDIVLKLPQPTMIGAASRVASKLTFGVDLTSFANI